MKKIIVLTNKDTNKSVAIATNAIAIVEPAIPFGSRVITTALESKYQNMTSSIEYRVHEDITFIVGAMNE